MRQDIERQKKLEPTRMEYAEKELTKRGYVITFKCDTRIEFTHDGSTVSLFPYSGWHTGKTITDGRGISKLLRQLNKC